MGVYHISVYEGKYTVVCGGAEPMRALRYGEEWRNLCGDNLVGAMAYEIMELRERLGLDPETGL